MFAITSGGRTIGHSELEFGDPPMGVAVGCFIPAESFDTFMRDVPPDTTQGRELRIWERLSAISPDGVLLDCAGVAVFRSDLGGEIGYEVTVLGIRSPSYHDLFPHHVEACEHQFRSADE